MFKDTDEWIRAIRNSSMNSKRQEKLIKGVVLNEMAQHVLNDQLCRQKDRSDKPKDCDIKIKGG